MIGAIVMFPSNVPGLAPNPWLIAVAAIGTAALFVLALAMLLRSRKRPVVIGEPALVGTEGEALSWEGGEGRVRVNGEIWRARATAPPQPGARIKVIGREGLVLLVASV